MRRPTERSGKAPRHRGLSAGPLRHCPSAKRCEHLGPGIGRARPDEGATDLRSGAGCIAPPGGRRPGGR
eukprot:14017282-Alexandrium_andersonii.AAC.1